MISTSSLQAFSASTTQAVGRPGAAEAMRLVRAQPEQAARTAVPAVTGPLPETRPSVPPPRGSLLNLSV